MVIGLVNVDALTMTAPVPVLRPMVIPLNPAANALISVVVICNVPAPPAIPMLVASVIGCNKRVLLPDTELAPPLKVIVFAVIVSALLPAAKFLPAITEPPVLFNNVAAPKVILSL